MLFLAEIVMVLTAVSAVFFAILTKLGAPRAYAAPVALVFSQSVMNAITGYLLVLRLLDSDAFFGFAFDVLAPAMLATWLLLSRSSYAAWTLGLFEILTLGAIALMVSEAASSNIYAVLNQPLYVDIAWHILIIVGLARIVFGWASDVRRVRELRVPPVFD